MAKRRPTPVFRLLNKTSGDWGAVHVLQLLDSLVVGEDIEAVVAGMPKGFLGEAFRNREFEGLECLRKRNFAVLGFADEEMNMLGHDDKAEDLEVVALAGEFERVEEDVLCRYGGEIGFAAVATEGDEVVVASSLESFET
jgi:hypothetical protein